MKKKGKAGKNRRFRLIQEGLDQCELGLKDVAARLGVSYNLVHRTVHGEINNRRVLRQLLELGVDHVALDLPQDLRGVIGKASGA